MRTLISALIVLSLSGCAWIIERERAVVEWKANTFRPAPVVPPASIRSQVQTAVPPVKMTEEEAEDPEVIRQRYCEWARTQFGLPILLNKGLKDAATEKLGKDDAAKLFWPLAKSNNAFRCLCGTPSEKKVAKC